MSLSFKDFISSFHHFIVIHFFFKNRIFHDQKVFEFFSQKFFSKNFWGKVHKTLLFSGLLDYPIFQPNHLLYNVLKFSGFNNGISDFFFHILTSFIVWIFNFRQIHYPFFFFKNLEERFIKLLCFQDFQDLDYPIFQPKFFEFFYFFSVSERH